MKAKDLKEKMQQGEDVVLLDVREGDEFNPDATVPGAKNVPMGKVFVQAAHGEIPKDKKIVTLCQKGGRCEIVARELSGKGYNIEHLEGGIDAWNKETQAE